GGEVTDQRLTDRDRLGNDALVSPSRTWALAERAVTDPVAVAVLQQVPRLVILGVQQNAANVRTGGGAQLGDRLADRGRHIGDERLLQHAGGVQDTGWFLRGACAVEQD